MPYVYTSSYTMGDRTIQNEPRHLVADASGTELVARTVVDFGVKDAKGRAVGMSRRATHQRVTLHETEPKRGEWGFEGVRYMLPVDHPVEWFEVRGISTRSGAGFGSADVCVKAATLEAALAEFDARVDRARKLAARKFGAVAVAA